MQIRKWMQVVCFSAACVLLNSAGIHHAGAATVLDIGFEVSEGYSTGNLSGQNSWVGDSDARIEVGDSLAKTGTQSLELNGRGSSSTILENYLPFDAVSGEFVWEFAVHGNGVINSVDNFIRLSDTGNDKYAVHLLLDGKGYSGFSINYVDVGGVHELVLIDDDNWHAVKIVGDTADDKFDFYLDGNLESSANPFHEDVDDLANLSVGSEQYSGGAYQMYVDDVKLTGVPEPATLALLSVGAGMMLRRRRL